MNRKFSSLVLALSLTFVLVGCSKPKTPAPASVEKEVAPVASAPETTEPTAETSEVLSDAEVSPSNESEPFSPVVEDTTQMELILDASGSMWGQVEGRAKIDVAKESMNRIIDDLKAKERLEVALRIYAHQNKECTNSVVEMPMGKIDAEGMKAKVATIKPLGMTPIYYSLTESVKDFKKDQAGDKVVVLVTDGLESCNGDPCAAAKALKEGGVVSKIHVVGFGLTKTELETLKCIAEPSGGLVVGASNATEFMSAMQEIMKKSLSFNLILNGKTAKNDKVGMTVKITQDGKEIAQKRGSVIQLMLPAGSYDIEAVSDEGLGTVNLNHVSVSEDKETEKDAIFVKTLLKVNVVGADGKPLSAKDMCVFPAGETEKEAKCAGIYTDKFEFKLPPGVYDLHLLNVATNEEAWEKGIEVRASEVANRTISFAQGSLKVNVVGADGKPLQSKDMCVFPAGETEKEVKCAGIYTDKYEFK
ncbi:VWA domain-containing protein, partial [Candidatus Peregrinibacteria bacterium]|nr:VWA domain-containing protein [Candidatus Peregrinibacteria bacterium]